MFFVLISSCNNTSIKNKEINNNNDTKTVLIHCGVTMFQPMTEIAQIIEQQENCKILITKGGSGNLLNSIETNKIGDLFLPGSEKFIESAMQLGLVTDTQFVGVNKAVIMVAKGNPLNIPENINCLYDTNYRIVIGHPNSGSIGKETKIILDKLGIYDEIQNRAEYLTIDSRDIVKSIKNNEADIVINWYATSTWENNSDFLQVLNIENDSLYFEEKKLYLSLLRFSANPELAQKIIDYASSSEGIAIFEKYGLF